MCSRSDAHDREIGLFGGGGVGRLSFVPRDLHVCHAPADQAWVFGRLLPALGLARERYWTRADDALGALQVGEIENAIEHCRYTLFVVSTASRWSDLLQYAARLAQHLTATGGVPRLLILTRGFRPDDLEASQQLPLGLRAQVNLGGGDEGALNASIERLRKLLGLDEPVVLPPIDCPYPGLDSFDASSSELLFGRDRDRDELLGRFRGGHTRVLIVGPSGSGKSSLVHGAVVPALEAEGAMVRVVARGGGLVAALYAAIDALGVPGLRAALEATRTAPRTPPDATYAARQRLREIAPPDARRRVVVIDPLEEVLIEVGPAGRTIVLETLRGLWSLPWCFVVLCMRADFLESLMNERVWTELEDAQYQLAPLDDAGLRAAIRRPAADAGVFIEDALIEELVQQVDDDRASMPLPMLQVTLRQLWAHVEVRYLSQASYLRLTHGHEHGLAAALAIHAGTVMDGLRGDDAIVAQRVFLDLAHLGEGDRTTRRRRTVAMLERAGDAPGQLDRVVDHLADGRLIKADVKRGGKGAAARHVDLAHEALLRGWMPLVRWLEEHRTALIRQRRMDERVRDFGEDPKRILTEHDTIETRRWIGSQEARLLGVSHALEALVIASEDAHARQRRERDETDRTRRAWRRLAVGALVGVALIAGGSAIRSYRLTNELRAEQTKTKQSLGHLMVTFRFFVHEIEDKLRRIAGASPAREQLLRGARARLDEIPDHGELGVAARRLERSLLRSEGAMAAERGRLAEARQKDQAALGAMWRDATTGHVDTAWFADLAAIYEQLGDVEKTAGRREEAAAAYGNFFAVHNALAALQASQARWQVGLARAHDRLGDLASLGGRWEEARRWYTASLVRRQGLVETAPDPDRRSALAVSFENLGQVAMDAGDLVEARAQFERALALRRELVSSTSAPEPDWRRDLAVSLNKVGNIEMAAGNRALARERFQEALSIASDLAETDPLIGEWARDRTIPLNRLGQLAADAEAARALFDEAFGIHARLAAADPDNAVWKRDLVLSLNKRGAVALCTAQHDLARELFSSALTLNNKLVELEPSREEWQGDLAFVHQRLGETAMEAKRWGLARDHLDQARGVRERMSAGRPSNLNVRGDLALTLEKLGKVAVESKDSKLAYGRYQDARIIRAGLAALDPADAMRQRALAEVLFELGILAAEHAPGEATHWHEAELQIRQRLATTRPDDPIARRALANAHDNVGWSLGDTPDGRAHHAQAAVHREEAEQMEARARATDAPTTAAIPPDVSASCPYLR